MKKMKSIVLLNLLFYLNNFTLIFIDGIYDIDGLLLIWKGVPLLLLLFSLLLNFDRTDINQKQFFRIRRLSTIDFYIKFLFIVIYFIIGYFKLFSLFFNLFLFFELILLLINILIVIKIYKLCQDNEHFINNENEEYNGFYIRHSDQLSNSYIYSLIAFIPLDDVITSFKFSILNIFAIFFSIFCFYYFFKIQYNIYKVIGKMRNFKINCIIMFLLIIGILMTSMMQISVYYVLMLYIPIFINDFFSFMNKKIKK